MRLEAERLFQILWSRMEFNIEPAYHVDDKSNQLCVLNRIVVQKWMIATQRSLVTGGIWQSHHRGTTQICFICRRGAYESGIKERSLPLALSLGAGESVLPMRLSEDLVAAARGEDSGSRTSDLIRDGPLFSCHMLLRNWKRLDSL
jgi:hypothetical protein